MGISSCCVLDQLILLRNTHCEDPAVSAPSAAHSVLLSRKSRQSLEDAHRFSALLDTPMILHMSAPWTNSTGPNSWQLHWVAQTRRPFLHCNCGSFLRLSMISSELPMDGWCIWPLESCHLFDKSLLGKEQQNNTEKLQTIGEIFAMEINILPPTHHQLRSKHLCDISQPQTSDWEWMMVRWRWLLDGYYTWWLSDQWPIRYLYILHKIIYIIICLLKLLQSKKSLAGTSQHAHLAPPEIQAKVRFQ